MEQLISIENNKILQNMYFQASFRQLYLLKIKIIFKLQYLWTILIDNFSQPR
jgi:hypothetical protein